jgi:hypothetical protein
VECGRKFEVVEADVLNEVRGDPWVSSELDIGLSNIKVFDTLRLLTH